MTFQDTAIVLVRIPTLILLAISIITIDFIILTFIFILTGLRTSGKHACPICGPSLVHEYADGLCKIIFDNHHQFLPSDHPKYVASKSNIHPQTLRAKDWKRIWESSNVLPPDGMNRYISIVFNLVCVVSKYWIIDDSLQSLV